MELAIYEGRGAAKGPITQATGNPELSREARYCWLQSRVAQALHQCAQRHRTVLVALRSSEQTCDELQAEVGKAVSAFTTFLGTEAARQHGWRVLRPAELQGASSLIEVMLQLQEKRVDPRGIELQNATGSRLPLTDHELYGLFTTHLETCRAAKDRLSDAHADRLRRENEVQESSKSLLLAESLERLGSLLDMSRPFSASKWKASLENMQHSLDQLKIACPPGIRNLLLLFSVVIKEQAADDHSHFRAHWVWADSTAEPVEMSDQSQLDKWIHSRQLADVKLQSAAAPARSAPQDDVMLERLGSLRAHGDRAEADHLRHEPNISLRGGHVRESSATEPARFLEVSGKGPYYGQMTSADDGALSQPSDGENQTLREKARAASRLQKQQQRQALRQMRDEMKIQARQQCAFEKEEKARMLEAKRKAGLKKKPPKPKIVKQAQKQPKARSKPGKRKRESLEEDVEEEAEDEGEQGSEYEVSGDGKASARRSTSNARLFPGNERRRISRLEKRVDVLNEEIEHVQKACRQSSRLASANQVHLREGFKNTRARGTEMGANTPERESEVQLKAKGKRAPKAQQASNYRVRKNKQHRVEGAEKDAADDCCSRTVPYSLLKAQKAHAKPPKPRLIGGARKQPRSERGQWKASLSNRPEDSWQNLKAESRDLVKFGRSPVHAWGLFAAVAIPKEKFIIEYVGETIRSSLEDIREANYLKSGLDSSYLFRLDESTVVDATVVGGLARYINHSCDPNCYTKIFTAEGKKHICIYSKKRISEGEELFYDYKFEREVGAEGVPCNCGGKSCTGRLN